MASLNGETVLLSASEDGTIRLWDLGTGAAVTLAGHIGEIHRIAVQQSGPGLEIAVITTHNHAYLWRIDRDRTTYLEAHIDLSEAVAPTSRGLNVAFLGSAPIVLFSREDNGIHAVDIRTALRVGLPALGHTGSVQYAVVGQVDHQTVVASLAYDDTVRISNLESGIPLGASLYIESRYQNVESGFIFGQVDGMPVGFTWSLEVRMWDLHSMHPIGEPLCGGDHDVAGLAIMPAPAAIPGPPLVVAGGFRGALRVHSLANGRQVAPHCTSMSYAYAMAAASVENTIIAAQGGWQEIHVWNVGTQQRISTFRGQDGVQSLRMHQLDGRWILVCAFEDPALQAWDLFSQAPVGTPLTGHTARVTDLATFDGKELLASTSDDGTARIWNLRTCEAVGAPLGDHELGAKAVCLGRLEGRDIVVTGDGAGNVRCWELLTGQPLGLDIPPHSDAIARLRTCTVNGVPILAVADSNGRIRVWNLSTRAQLMEINAESSIQDTALTDTAELCVATDMGVVMLKLNLARGGD